MKRASVILLLLAVPMGACASGTSHDLPTCSGKADQRRPLNAGKWQPPKKPAREAGNAYSQAHAGC